MRQQRSKISFKQTLPERTVLHELSQRSGCIDSHAGEHVAKEGDEEVNEVEVVGFGGLGEGGEEPFATKRGAFSHVPHIVFKT